jgi:hypothetical protein
MASSGHIGNHDVFAVGEPGAYQWMATTVEVHVTLRGFTLMLISAETGHNRMHDQARKDPLTGVMNRSGLRASFDLLASARERAGIVAGVDSRHRPRPFQNDK